MIRIFLIFYILFASLSFISCKTDIDVVEETTGNNLIDDSNDSEEDEEEVILPLELDAVADFAATEGTAITALDNGDSGADVDSEGAAITYQCYFDVVIDDAVTSPVLCSLLSGLSFNSTTGVFNWTPNFAAFQNGDVSGRYEFKIIGTSSNGSDEEIFVVTVTDILPHQHPDQEWIEVPANAGGLGLPSFWVMKYEAKAWNDANSDGDIDAGEVDADGCNEGACTTDSWGEASNVPVSVADNLPWRRITPVNALSECESLGTNYTLITNYEWMAIARDIESQGDNWTGDAVGSGCLFRGNNDEATVGDGSNIADSCGYNGSDPEAGAGRDIRSKHILSNASEIYDIAGNVWEWIDWDDPYAPTAGFQTGVAGCGPAELPAIVCGSLIDIEYNTINGGYDSTDGVGYVNAGGGGATRRGGGMYNTTNAGVFTLYAISDPTNFAWGDIGFRCIYRP